MAAALFENRRQFREHFIHDGFRNRFQLFPASRSKI
jgi:hypothetical protein